MFAFNCLHSKVCIQLRFIGDTVEAEKESKDGSKPTEVGKESKDGSKPTEVVKNTHSMYLSSFVRKYSN